MESRCFLKMTKKVDKQIQQHNLAKLNVCKYNEQPKTLVNGLLDIIDEKREERVNWLSLNKKDNVQRSSLFLRLTKVRAASSGFVVCDCEIDLDRMADVILFKYDNLKTLLPTHYANEFELSNQAVLEYVGPWSAYDNDKLKTSFIINPFWIHILHHGTSEHEEDEYDIVFRAE